MLWRIPVDTRGARSGLMFIHFDGSAGTGHRRPARDRYRCRSSIRPPAIGKKGSGNLRNLGMEGAPAESTPPERGSGNCGNRCLAQGGHRTPSRGSQKAVLIVVRKNSRSRLPVHAQYCVLSLPLLVRRGSASTFAESAFGRQPWKPPERKHCWQMCPHHGVATGSWRSGRFSPRPEARDRA